MDATKKGKTAQAPMLDEVHNKEFESIAIQLTLSDIKKLCEMKSNFIDIDCPACLSKAKTLEYTIVDLEYFRCLKCGTVYVTPCPTEEIIGWYLEESEGLRFWRENMPSHIIESRKKNIYSERVRFILESAKICNVDPDIVLDIGGGNGELAESLAMEKTIKKVIMVEPQPVSLKSNKVEVLQTSIENVRRLNEKANIITAFEVIEHIPHPEKLLAKIGDFLRPDGIIILSTPNIDGFETSTLKTLSRICWFDHIILYNTRSLPILLRRCGYEVLDIHTPGQFDYQTIRREYLDRRINFPDNPALMYLMEDGAIYGEEFQAFLRARGLSSHMKCVGKLSV